MNAKGKTQPEPVLAPFTAAAGDEHRHLAMWVVYDRPSDHPEHFVARCWRIEPGKTLPTADVLLAPTLEGVRQALPGGLTRLDRAEGDDPVVVETWI